MRTERQKIILINRYFHPDKSATSQLLSDLAFHLAANGKSIHVITSRQRYDSPKAALPTDETVNGVHINRLNTTGFGRSGIAGRAVDYLSFYLLAARRLTGIANPGDILIAKTDPPLLSILAHRARRRSRVRTVNWLQDVYPEIASALRVPFVKGWPLRRLTAWRNRSLRQADANVVLGKTMARYIRSCGVPDDVIHIIPNWIDDRTIVPLPSAENPLRKAWHLHDCFVIEYSGNLGRAHDYETIVGAAQLLRNHDRRLAFLMIGGGRQAELLKARVADLGLDAFFHFKPYREQNELIESLGAADVHWLSLKPEVEGFVFPSKFYGIAAAGRPILAIIDPDSEIAQLIRLHDCGYAIKPGDAEALASVIKILSYDAPLVAKKGRNARLMLESDFTRSRAMKRWTELLESVARSD